MAELEDPLTRLDLIMRHGAKRTITFAFTDGSGNAVDLTPFTSGDGLTLRVEKISDGTFPIVKTSSPAAGITIATPTNGQAVVAFTAGELSLLEVGEGIYQYDIFGDDAGAGGAEALLAVSCFTVVPSVGVP